MLHRTTLLILYRLYQNSDDDIFKDEIINNIDLIVSQNSSSINNLNTGGLFFHLQKFLNYQI